MRIKFIHRYGGLFKFIKVLKHNYLHRNGLTSREVLWANCFTNYLKSFCIIKCVFQSNLLCQLKNISCHLPAYLFSKDINMWKTKSKCFIYWNVIFWMKIQNAAWFQYKTFLFCNFPFLDIFYIHAWRTFFSIIRQ